jgi:hypothetical protein
MKSIEATRLEYTTALMIIAEVTDVMEGHHEEEDLKAAVQAVFLTALEMVSGKALHPLEELFDDE